MRGFAAMTLRIWWGPSTLCYAIVLPGRKSAFRAGFWPDCYREATEIGPPAGLRPPYFWMVFKPPGAAQTPKTDPQNSGQTAFRYPDKVWTVPEMGTNKQNLISWPNFMKN